MKQGTDLEVSKQLATNFSFHGRICLDVTPIVQNEMWYIFKIGLLSSISACKALLKHQYEKNLLWFLNWQHLQNRTCFSKHILPLINKDQTNLSASRSSPFDFNSFHLTIMLLLCFLIFIFDYHLIFLFYSVTGIEIFRFNCVMAIITAQPHSTKPELRFCTGLIPASSMSEIHAMVRISDSGPSWK